MLDHRGGDDSDTLSPTGVAPCDVPSVVGCVEVFVVRGNIISDDCAIRGLVAGSGAVPFAVSVILPATRLFRRRSRIGWQRRIVARLRGRPRHELTQTEVGLLCP